MYDRAPATASHRAGVALLLALSVMSACAAQRPAVVHEATDLKVTSPGLAHKVHPKLSFLNAEVLLGDRLFFETRFAHFFFERSRGVVNTRLPVGDPIVEQVVNASGESLPGPFRGLSMNCRQCHLGSDFVDTMPFAGRTYSDFSRRSPVPLRPDGVRQTIRNSPHMISLALSREVPLLLHYDAEFGSFEDLIVETLVGRNFGWLPDERTTAIAHIARVIRQDEGANPRFLVDRGRQGIPYKVAMVGTDESLAARQRLPTDYRIDVTLASDIEVLRAVAVFIHAYIDSLRFGVGTFRTALAPYDVFLEKNGLPMMPNDGELAANYTRRLAAAFAQRADLLWVTETDGHFSLHSQKYVFGPTELSGLNVFIKNCATCHPPPQFTDHRLHNTGVSQVEYDAIFGDGGFSRLYVPDLATRNASVEQYLPQSPSYPNASGRFRAAPSVSRPGFADLGVWNVFANPDIPGPQKALRAVLCEEFKVTTDKCTPSLLLPMTIGYFKTPSIRDLGQSDPYFHSGSVGTIEAVLEHYSKMAQMARLGKVRNASPELMKIYLNSDDIADVVAFLRALNEDYQ